MMQHANNINGAILIFLSKATYNCYVRGCTPRQGRVKHLGQGGMARGISLIGHAPFPWGNGPATTAGKHPRGNTAAHYLSLC